MNFQQSLEFMQKYTKVHVLSGTDNQNQVMVCPDLQGRVMTSTATGPDGLSFGWINTELLSSGEDNQHFNAYGGEERLWLGPEGGQFSIFFAPNDPFDLDHWYTPPAVNSEPWDVLDAGQNRIVMRKNMKLTNYSGTNFDVTIDRSVDLLDEANIDSVLGLTVNDLKVVGYQSVNTLGNSGDNAWEKESGLLSIWMLGMFVPSPATTVVIPFKTGPEEELGPIVNDVYFGAVPQDRLQIKDGKIFFKCDGKQRGKIGISPQRVIPWAGGYDAENKVLTLITFSFDPANTEYVNSLWEIQDQPFAGDVLNSYNDGPTSPGGKPLGPFYEIESSSPAAQLAPGGSLVHTHTTIHLTGSEAALDVVAKSVLGVGIQEIKTTFQ